MTPWQSLPTRNKSLPPLLYSFSYSSHFYEFRLTDLTYIWFERLEYKHILRRAEGNETSIDPSEDVNQYGLFMQKIEDALRGTKSTTVNVISDPRIWTSLSVTTSTDLPGGLRPLEWSFSLFREPPSAVTLQLLLPLLKSEREREKREQSLLEHIRDKDKVLFKIFDNIDPSQLTSMFPGTAGTRHVKLKTSELTKHIKGATEFNEKTWRGNFDHDNIVAADVEGFEKAMSRFKTETTSAAWWENLGDAESASKSQENTRGKDHSSPDSEEIKIREAGLDEDKSTEDEDEFQRQETPPHLKRKREEPVQRPFYENRSDKMGITTDSVQTDQSTEEDRRSPPPQKAKPLKKALGRIGGPKAIPSSRSLKDSISSTDANELADIPKPQKRTTAVQKAPGLDHDSLSESENKSLLTTEPPVHRKDSPCEKFSTKQNRSLGRIGGRKPEPKPEPNPASPEIPDNEVETQSSSDDDDLDQRRQRAPKPLRISPQKTKKLGIIGGGKKKPQPAAIQSPDQGSGSDGPDGRPSKKNSAAQEIFPSSSPAPAPPKAPSRSPSLIQRGRVPKVDPESEPEPELTAEEKANRKREELRRQLDARSKAPAKKKRKF